MFDTLFKKKVEAKKSDYTTMKQKLLTFSDANILSDELKEEVKDVLNKVDLLIQCEDISDLDGRYKSIITRVVDEAKEFATGKKKKIKEKVEEAVQAVSDTETPNETEVEEGKDLLDAAASLKVNADADPNSAVYKDKGTITKLVTLNDSLMNIKTNNPPKKETIGTDVITPGDKEKLLSQTKENTIKTENVTTKITLKIDREDGEKGKLLKEPKLKMPVGDKVVTNATKVSPLIIDKTSPRWMLNQQLDKLPLTDEPGTNSWGRSNLPPNYFSVLVQNIENIGTPEEKKLLEEYNAATGFAKAVIKQEIIDNDIAQSRSHVESSLKNMFMKKAVIAPPKPTEDPGQDMKWVLEEDNIWKKVPKATPSAEQKVTSASLYTESLFKKAEIAPVTDEDRELDIAFDTVLAEINKFE